MGSGEGRHPRNFHLHMHFHGRREGARDVPKGCLAITVGQEGEEQQRFVVPVMYFSHPLFMQLLKDAEDEYGFDHQGPINIPCHVAHFRYVQGLIDREAAAAAAHHHHPLPCFRA